MTKVIILGETTSKKELKPIEFVKSIYEEISDTTSTPPNYDFIELIAKNYYENNYDLMFAYNENNRSDGSLYYGYFNDGIV